jgi:hypothetical protein
VTGMSTTYKPRARPSSCAFRSIAHQLGAACTQYLENLRIIYHLKRWKYRSKYALSGVINYRCALHFFLGYS